MCYYSSCTLHRLVLRSIPSLPPLDIVAVIPARFASTRFPGKAARRHRRPSDDRARLPARRGVAGRLARHRRHRRPADCDDGHRVWRQRPADARRSRNRHRPPRRSRRVARLRHRRQRAGRRAAARSARDRRGGRAVLRPVDPDDDALSADPQSGRADQSERRQGGARSRRLRAVFLARADPARARSARRLAAALSSISASTRIAAAPCWCWPRSSRRRSSGPSRSSSCARSSTAFASRPSKRPTTRSAWTRRRISEQVRRLLAATSRIERTDARA